MIKTETIAKGKCFGSPVRQRDSLVLKKFRGAKKLKSAPKIFKNNLAAGVIVKF